jgi:hypothetical protein
MRISATKPVINIIDISLGIGRIVLSPVFKTTPALNNNNLPKIS